MFNINDYVFSMRFGIGIVKELKDNKYNVKYKDGYTLENEADLYLISNDVIETLRNDNYKDFFSINVLEKGKEYFISDRVKNLIVMGRSINSTAIGTIPYQVSIMITKSNIRGKCSCPVGSMCKHTLATLIALKNELLELNNYNETNSTKDYTEIFNKALSINPNITKYKDLLSIDELYIMMIRSINSANDMKEFLLSLNKYRIDTNNYKETKNIVYTIIALSNLYQYIVELDNEGFNPTILNMIDKIAMNNISELIKPYYIDKFILTNVVIYSITNDKYGYYFQILSRISDFHRDFIISKFNDKVLKELIDNNIINKLPVDLVKELYLKCDISGKKIIASKYTGKLLTIDELNEFEPADGIELIGRLTNPTDVVDYVCDNYKYLVKYNKKKLYGACITALSLNIKRSQHNNIMMLLEDDNNAKYILDYLNTGDIRVDDEELFLEIFDIKYNLSIKNDLLFEEYYLFLDDKQLFTMQYMDNKAYYGVESRYVYEAIRKILTHDNKYLSELKKINYKLKASHIDELREEYIKKINNLNTSIKRVVSLPSSLRINVDYQIREMDEYERFKRSDNSSYFMSFKVSSTGRGYIVKDAYNFLNLIENSLDSKYGKELEFNHNINNFSDKDRSILRILLDSQFDYANKGRELPISERILQNIIELLRDRYIEFNGVNRYVRLDYKDFNPTINGEYLLTSGTDNAKIFGVDKVFIVYEGFVDYLKVEDKNIEFAKFVYDNEGMDVSIVKDLFIDKVYSRYGSLIKVDNSISTEFRLSELRIDSYFDYVKNVIRCETKIYKDDVLLTSDEFLNEMDRVHLGTYLEYLKELGFVNNEVLSEPSKIIAFLRMDFTYLKSICNVYLSDSILAKKVSSFTTPTITIKHDKSMMEAFVGDSIYSDEELFEIMKAIRQKKNFVLLSDDRIITLDDKKANEFYDAVVDFRLDLKALTAPQELMVYQSLKAYQYLDNCDIDDYVSKMIEDISNFKNQDYEIPKINAELRNYQVDGYKWLKTLNKYKLGGILADDMGLGKTLEVITLLKGDEVLKQSLIICPKSLLFNWYSEINKFDGLTRVIIIYGNQNQRKKLINNINRCAKIIYITSYDSLRSDVDYYKDISFNYIILDEAQAIKNVNAIKSIKVKSLNGDNRFALTGTPIENNIIDLWSIFDFIMPGYLEELSSFRSKASNSEYLDRVAKKVSPFILRRTKKEVLKDLPEKYERIISCEMTPEQRKIYDAHVKDAQIKLESGTSAFDLLPYLTRLRQICIDPKIFMDSYAFYSGKLNELEDILIEYKDEHKILIFSSFVMALNNVMKILDRNDIKYYVLTGDTKLEERTRLVNDFNHNDEIRVFLISLKAGGTGLNLVGADTVIHLDPWWNVSAENQASDRAHRMGQTKNVEVIKLVAFDSIEERVIELQNLKKDIIDKVISKDESSITSLTIDDLKYILE